MCVSPRYLDFGLFPGASTCGTKTNTMGLPTNIISTPHSKGEVPSFDSEGTKRFTAALGKPDGLGEMTTGDRCQAFHFPFDIQSLTICIPTKLPGRCLLKRIAVTHQFILFSNVILYSLV